MVRKFKYLALLCAFCLPFMASAQNENTKVDQEIENIKAQLSKVMRMADLSGYVNYQFDCSDDATTLNARHIRLDLKGALNKYVDYRVHADFANSPKIVDAFVKFKISRAFNIKIGQYHAPITLENPYHPLDLESVEYSQLVAKFSGISDVCGLSCGGRDIGITATGGFFYNEQKNFNIVEYTAGFFNGNGINNKDNNRHKDFGAEVMVHPVKPLTLYASIYQGKYTNPTVDAPDQRERWGFGVRYDDHKYMFRSEYMQGKTWGLESQGAYAVAGYWFTPKFMSYLKYDWFEENKDCGNSNWYSVGMQYWPWKFLRIVAGYTYKDIENLASNNNTHKNLFNAMVSFKF